MPKRRVVHFQCLKDEDRKDTEIGGLKRAGKLDDDELIVIEAFKAPVPLTAVSHATHVTIGGSGWSVWEDIPHIDKLRLVIHYAEDSLTLPVLGICFGGQLLADLFGGQVVRDKTRAEYGTTDIRLAEAAGSDPLFAGLPDPLLVQSSHHDRIARLPPRSVLLASSRDGAVPQAFKLEASRIYGVQFHPERGRRDALKLLEPQHCDYPEEKASAIRATLRETPGASSILERFFHL